MAPIRINFSEKWGGATSLFNQTTSVFSSVSKTQHEHPTGRTYLSGVGRAVAVAMEWVELAAVAVREVEPAVSQLAALVPGRCGLDLHTRWREAFRVPEPSDRV